MKTENLYSLYSGQSVVYKNSIERAKTLKDNEIISIKKLCEVFERFSAPYSVYNGYIVGYVIPQISKEFDLLRFSKDLVINVELKGWLKQEVKREKVINQLKKNYYYLKFLDRKIRLFTFVENDGVYEYNPKTDNIKKIEINQLISLLEKQKPTEKVELKEIFKPSNYLISPFTKTESFVNGEYFLTNDQETVKKAVTKGIEEKTYNFYCVSASAGTGKTLLVYDIANAFMKRGKKTLVVHCGKLHGGQLKLNEKYGWNIISFNSLTEDDLPRIINENDLVVIDEAQRIPQNILNNLIITAEKTPVIFSYDGKQDIYSESDVCVKESIKKVCPNNAVYYKQLTNKIRTNKQTAYFINSLMQMGKRKKYDYSSVSIEYFDTLTQVNEYVNYINKNGWQTLSYNTEMDIEGAIGQEYDKVAVVMDRNFYYDKDGRLTFAKGNFNLKSALYQLVTRAVDKLKIIVLDNPELYERLLKLKNYNDKK